MPDFGRRAAKRVGRGGPRTRKPYNFSCWISCRLRLYKISAKANTSHPKMPTTSAAEPVRESETVTEAADAPRAPVRRALPRFARELLIFLAFGVLTAVMTW